AAAAQAFDLLTCEPAPLSFDARGLPVLPQRILPLDELREVLIADSTPKPVRDLVWRDLVERARRDGPAWVVAAVGIAMPGLRMRAGVLTRRWHGDTADLDAEMISGFVERLKTINLDAPRICGRLIDAGARAVKKSRLAEEEASAVHVDTAWSPRSRPGSWTGKPCTPAPPPYKPSGVKPSAPRPSPQPPSGRPSARRLGSAPRLRHDRNLNPPIRRQPSGRRPPQRSPPHF